MKLFVDCDDTLVVWHEEHQNQDKTLWIRDNWSLDEYLIGFLEGVLATEEDMTLIIWSGGGLDYATLWAERCKFSTPWIALSKDTTIPKDEDICIDDERLVLRNKARVFTKEEFYRLYLRL